MVYFPLNYGLENKRMEESIHTICLEYLSSWGWKAEKSFKWGKKINKAYFIAAIMSILFNITQD